MTAPLKADSTTKICEMPVKGEAKRSPSPRAAVVATSVVVAASSAGGSNGLVRNSDVKVTILNAKVHRGILEHSFNEAATKGVAAAPMIVEVVATKTLAGPKTAAAHPTRQPL